MRPFGFFCVILPCAPAFAQQVTPLVWEGYTVPGVGLVTSIDRVAINGAGTWIVEADTDNPDSAVDGVLIQNGALLVQEGQSMSAPPGSAVGDFGSLWLNVAGDGAFHFKLDGTSGAGDDAGIFWNTTLVLQEGAISAAPQFTTSTPYKYFSNLYVNSADQILISSSVNDPNLAGSSNKALVLLNTDGAGNLTAETVISKQGDLAGSGSWPVDHPCTRAQEFSLNDAGQVLYTVYIDSGTAVDAAIYLDSTLLAEELALSPIPGRSWDLLTNPELGLNNNGDCVFSGRLDGDPGTNWVIIKNGTKFVQEGESLPAIGGYTITNFGSGPIEIAENGAVLWYADWNDPNTDIDSGLLVNDRLIVQEGVTQVGGVLIDTIRGTDSGYHFSPSGQYVIFKGVLDDGVEAAFAVDLSVGTPFCFGDGTGTACPCGNQNNGAPGGCDWGNPAFPQGGILEATGTNSFAAGNTYLVATGIENNFGIFFGAHNQVNGGNGTLLNDGLRCAGGGLVRLVPPTVAMGNQATTPMPVQALDAGAASGVIRRYQYWFRTPGGPCGQMANLTNGYEIVWVP